MTLMSLMRITWSPDFKQFVTHARTESLNLDVGALKKAGWKTEGPPSWGWVAFRASNLIKLKKAIPSGITLTPEALERFNTLKEAEDKNAAVKAALKAHRKEVGKIEDPAKGFKFVVGPEGFLIAEVETVEPEKKLNLTRPPAASCHICQTSIYFLELQDPPTCLDCEFDPGL